MGLKIELSRQTDVVLGACPVGRPTAVVVPAQDCDRRGSLAGNRTRGAGARPSSRQSRRPAREFLVRAVARPWAVFAVLLVGLLWSYWPTLDDLAAFWSRNPDYSAGALVPLVAAYVIWSRRKALQQTRVETCWAGLVLLLAAQAVRFLGLLYMYSSLERLSFLLTVGAGCLLILGWRVTRQLSPVLAFLALMFPLPGRLHEALALPLQNFASRSAVVGLEMLGYLVKQEGNVLSLNDQTPVAVAEACSGLRMLTAFVIVSAALTFVVRRPAWQKVFIFASSIPVAILANTLRLVATVMVLDVVGSSAGEQFFHNSAGIVMIPFAWAVLMGELWLLRWIAGVPGNTAGTQAASAVVGTRRAGRKAASGEASGFAPASPWFALRGSAVGAAIAVMVLAGAGHRALASRIDLALGRSVALRHPLSTLPLQLGRWQGRDVPLDEQVRRIAGDDDFLNRQYMDEAGGRAIGLYVGYVGRPRSRMGHRPDVCYPAHGFQETSRQSIIVKSSDGAQVPAMLYEFTNPQPGGGHARVLATYVMNGRYVTDVAGSGGLNGRRVGLGATPETYLARVQVSLQASGDRTADVAVLCEFASLLYGPLAAMMPVPGGQ